MRPLIPLALILMLAACGQEPAAPVAASAPLPLVKPVAETVPGLPDGGAKGDADDPSFWLHPDDPARSLVITAAKGAGLRVYDLQGKLVQRIDAETEGRYNNVDVAYGLKRPDGSTIDIAVASDRGRDRLMVWAIDPANPAAPLTDITDPTQGQVFPTRLSPDGMAEVTNPVADQASAYGLTLWKDKATGEVRAVVAQRNAARLAEQRLVIRADGTVGHERTRHWDFPTTHKGQDLTAENDNDPALDWQPQFEGLVVDEEAGILFAGQEDVGLWRVNLTTGKADDQPFYETRGSVKSPFNSQDSKVARDVEGLALYRGADGTGYLIASSQGDAHGDEKAPDAAGLDDSFAIFERGGHNRYLGSFKLTANGAIDAGQECDGAELISIPLPGYPAGLLVVQDGYNDDLNGLNGEPEATNFKYISWAELVAAMPQLTVKAGGWSPR
ncbi:phytase [Niveispirillum cyanobacteriorum]|uniref:Hydrolase n=1 Tax=Niveispirillum cyanobacteriorum TaxID=1612173 RepID=A0A2K9NME6_9PROT|nr:phytase [Niveispirillum cyanobacteriorum]AUN33776.1 hydrolase [Niveispirillum cyanobacteriorum]GGE82687.1 hydrolase [Niveispirillum cyanobacteriorum]